MSLTRSLFSTFIMRDMARNRFRTFFTTAAVALGVAVMLSIQLANDTALSSFSHSIDLVAGKSNMEVRPSAEPDMDETCLAKMSWMKENNIPYTPVIDRLAQMQDTPNELVQVLGVDMFADKAFHDTDAKTHEMATDLEIFRLNRAWVGAKLAAAHKLAKGSKYKMMVNDRVVDMVCVGVLPDKGMARAFSGNLMLMDIGTAQELFDMRGKISHISFVVPDDRMSAVQAKLTQMFEKGFNVGSPARRSETVSKMLRSFQFNLVALSLIALLVAGFLIYNTVSIGVIRRRWELGTLRAMGVKKGTLLTLILGQAFIWGVAGSALGIPLGIGFASSALVTMTKTVQSLYADQPRSDLVLSLPIIGIAFGLGILITLLAALAPALEATSIAPAEATRRQSLERKIESMSGKLVGLAVVLAGAAYFCSTLPPLAGFPIYGYLAAALAVFAAALLTPGLLYLVFKVLMPVASSVGLEMKLAIATLRGAVGRTSVAVASLVVGISMMVSLAVMIGSFRQTVVLWVNQTLKADLWIEPDIRRQSNRTGYLSDATVQTIRSLKGVKAVDSFVEMPIELEGLPTNLAAGELDVMARLGNIPFVDNEPCSEVMARAQGHDSVVVSEPFAIKHNKKKGDTVVLKTRQGDYAVKIEGIYYDYSSDMGYIVLPRDVFAKHFNDKGSTSATVFLEKDVNPDDVKKELAEKLGKNASLNIRTNSELKQAALRVFDNTFAVTYALHAISILVAIFGVANALISLVMESKRDISILQYLGAEGRQIGIMVVIQSALLGVLGAGGGLGLGLVLSQLLIHVINKQSFGWTIQFFMPSDFLVQSLLIVVGCAVVAGLIPARMATTIPAPSELRSE